MGRGARVGEDATGGVRRIAPLDDGKDRLGAGVFPARIVDGHEVVVAPHAEAVEDLPGLLEQRMTRVRGWQRDDLDPVAVAPAALLLADRTWVRQPPSTSSLALGLGIGRAPRAEVVGSPIAQPALRVAGLGSTPFRVALAIAALPFAGSAPTGLGIVAVGIPRLVDAETDDRAEGAVAGRAVVRRHVPSSQGDLAQPGREETVA